MSLIKELMLGIVVALVVGCWGGGGGGCDLVVLSLLSEGADMASDRYEGAVRLGSIALDDGGLDTLGKA